MHIHLIGPGGSGKTSTGRILASSLDLDFIDLDEYFLSHNGNIDNYIKDFSYNDYAKQNVENYIQLLKTITNKSVIALSSGFMLYSDNTHVYYSQIKQDILNSDTTFILLASLDRDECIKRTVQRQLARPFGSGTAKIEEIKIRKRFILYNEFDCCKISTEDAPEIVAVNIVKKLISL